MGSRLCLYGEHHHLIIDDTFVKEGEVVPMNKTHLHFGKGQTSDQILGFISLRSEQARPVIPFSHLHSLLH